MGSIQILGVEIKKVSIKELLFNKVMLLSYVLLAIGIYGIYEIIKLRYGFAGAITSHDLALQANNPHLMEHMREAIYGEGAEVHREAPWTLFIVNYMYMIYTGSGIIFLVALDELLGLEIMKKTAAGFMTFGISMVFGGLFTILVDLNPLNMLWMVKTPNVTAGMWQMLPLYCIYIPFVLFEIYLLITKKHDLVKKISFVVLLLSVFIDIAEYYIQAGLFNLNTARHLWTTYPILTLYFIISSYVAAIGVMIIYSYFAYSKKLGGEYHSLIEILRKTALITITLLAVYEASAYLFIDKNWAYIILFGPLRYLFFGGYIFLAMTIPYLLMLRESKDILTIIGAIFIIVGTYVGRYVFVYGGNAYPMSNHFGTGFTKWGMYEQIKSVIYYPPEVPEILVVIGSVGVVLAAYTLINKLFSVTMIREH